MILFEVMKEEGAYLAPSTYYFSHISYLKGNPQVALEGFEAISTHPDFIDVVPTYIAQTLHATEQFSRLKEYGPPLLDESAGLDKKERTEISRLVGDAFYKDQDFESASPFLELAWEGTRGPDRKAEFAYEVGYTRYRIGAWSERIERPGDNRSRRRQAGTKRDLPYGGLLYSTRSKRQSEKRIRTGSI